MSKNRVLAVECENDCWMEVFYHNGVPLGQYENDRIEVVIKPEGESPHGWYMTVSEADALKSGLALAIHRARKDKVLEG